MGGQGGDGLGGKGKLLQEFRVGPGDDHISFVQDPVYKVVYVSERGEMAVQKRLPRSLVSLPQFVQMRIQMALPSRIWSCVSPQ